MAEGNTLFLLGSSNLFSEEETTDEFGLMPFLSEDGTRNTFVLNVNRYIGINKHLEAEGSEQKLEDALHVMEVLSSVEGMQALNSFYSDTSLLPLKDYTVSTEGYYADILDELNSGATAPLIYNGWENIIVNIGESMISFVRGECSLDDVISAIDGNQHLIWDNSSQYYTTVTQKIDTEHCAKLVGICFAEASGADMALISMNKWYRMDDSGDLNLDGVSGALFPLPVSDQELTSILPTGWRQNIQTVTLTGKRVKELAETGYDRSGELLFPYELVTPEGFVIDDDTVYTVAIAGVTDEVAEGGDLTDTGRRADRADGLSGAAQRVRCLAVGDHGRGQHGPLLHTKRHTGHAHGPELPRRRARARELRIQCHDHGQVGNGIPAEAAGACAHPRRRAERHSDLLRRLPQHDGADTVL